LTAPAPGLTVVMNGLIPNSVHYTGYEFGSYKYSVQNMYMY